MKLINWFKNKFIKKSKKMKIEVGKTYKVITTPAGKVSSGCLGTHVNQCGFETIVKVVKEFTDAELGCRAISGDKMYSACVIKYNGQPYNATYSVYEYELKPFIVSIESLDEDIKKAQEEIEKLKEEIKDCEDKKTFLVEQKIDEFSEEEFKAYQVLKVMGIDDINKAKQITKILGR